MSKFIGYQLHDLLREIGVLPDHVAIESVRLIARKGEKCRLVYTTPASSRDGLAHVHEHTTELAWRPLLVAFMETGVLGQANYCRAFTIDAPHDGVCTITYEYFADKERLFAGLRAARIAQSIEEALVR